MAEKRWKIKQLPTTESDKQIVFDLADKVTKNITLATLLWQRGITDFEEARTFFRPQLSHLHDPFLMPDMHKAVKRLNEAIQKGEKILIYGDYDVDGTTSVAMFYGFLLNHYKNLLFYTPDRYTEGYGVSQKGMEHAHNQGVSLIITLDCGVKSVEIIAKTKVDFGIDFIVCDHHEPGDELPAAVAVLDAKRKDSVYPYNELTGCGVGFKFLQAFCQTNNIAEENLFEYLDLVVTSIACDIVPITGENRVLAHYGLKKINSNPRTGLKALKDVAAFNGEMSIENVVFGFGPRINAAGRIKHAEAAIKLLLSDDYDEAVEFAHEIQKYNEERRKHDASITNEALAMIEESSQAKSTVLYREDWHKGVIGIVASRCIERFYRPTIILTQSNGKAAGSGRSVIGFNLYEAIEECSHLLEQFGGHFYAAGLTLPIENIDKFREEFDKVVTRKITEEQLIPQIEIDLVIELADINQKFYNIVKQMSPFGPQNMLPIFMTRSVRLAEKPFVMKEKHLKLTLLDEETGVTFTGVGFGMAQDFYDRLLTNKYFDVVYQIEENHYRDKTTLQLYLKDIKFN
jgi:single-stranded-DNA-specific exonuclease